MEKEGQINTEPKEREGYQSSNEEGQQPPQEPSQQPSQTPPPTSQQQSVPPHQPRQPKEDFLKRVTSNDGLAKFITVGFILILVGMLLVHAAPFFTNWGRAQYDMSREERADDRASQNTMNYIGNFLQDFGIFFISLFLILGSIHRDDLSQRYRISMMALGLLFTLVAWFGFLAPLLQLG